MGKVDVSSQLSFRLAERGNKILTNESRQALCWKMTQAYTILPALQPVLLPAARGSLFHSPHGLEAGKTLPEGHTGMKSVLEK